MIEITEAIRVLLRATPWATDGLQRECLDALCEDDSVPVSAPLARTRDEGPSETRISPGCYGTTFVYGINLYNTVSYLRGYQVYDTGRMFTLKLRKNVGSSQYSII